MWAFSQAQKQTGAMHLPKVSCLLFMPVVQYGGNAVETSPSIPAPRDGLRAARAVCRDRGISDVTLWRMARRGDVIVVNVYGRCYVDLQSLADFDRRARAGEFAKKPVGAAAKSAKTNAASQPTGKGAK